MSTEEIMAIDQFCPVQQSAYQAAHIIEDIAGITSCKRHVRISAKICTIVRLGRGTFLGANLLARLYGLQRRETIVYLHRLLEVLEVRDTYKFGVKKDLS